MPNKSASTPALRATPPAQTNQVVRVADDLVTINERRYQIVLSEKDGFDAAALSARYAEILDKYDYVVGDWGYDQLRLRGFYQDGSRQGNKDQTIATLADYLTEYCNFGCAYFVLARLDAPVVKKQRPASRERRRPRKSKPQPEARKAAPQAETVAQNKPRRRHFKIRQRETNKK